MNLNLPPANPVHQVELLKLPADVVGLNVKEKSMTTVQNIADDVVSKEAFMSAKWFCSLCWREGTIEFGEPAIEIAKGEHRALVKFDMAAGRIPAGMSPQMSGSPRMTKYPAVYCAGDIKTGERKSRERQPFDKSLSTKFDFEKGNR